MQTAPEPEDGDSRGASTAPADDASSETGDLSAFDKSMLDFEDFFPAHSIAKERRIWAEFGMTSARYYAAIEDIARTPAAIKYRPLLVARLGRMRYARTQERARRQQRIRAARSA